MRIHARGLIWPCMTCCKGLLSECVTSSGELEALLTEEAAWRAPLGKSVAELCGAHTSSSAVVTVYGSDPRAGQADCACARYMSAGGTFAMHTSS